MSFIFWFIVFVSVTYGAVDKALLPEINCADEMKAIKERLAKVEEEQELEKERDFRLNHGSGRRSYEVDAVAFFATIGATVDHLGQGQTVVFDQLLTMIDSTHSVGAYSATTGVFTAPLNGLYVFSVTLLALNTHATHLALHKNNTPLSTIYVNANSASSTVTVSLVRGDSMYVKHMDNDHGLYGAFYGGQSTFTGFLLQREYDDSPVVG